MDEVSKSITITEAEAHRLVWALHRLSDWMRQSNAKQPQIDKGIRENNDLIDRIRAPFQTDK